jgi:hypothetical protein
LANWSAVRLEVRCRTKPFPHWYCPLLPFCEQWSTSINLKGSPMPVRPLLQNGFLMFISCRMHMRSFSFWSYGPRSSAEDKTLGRFSGIQNSNVSLQCGVSSRPHLRVELAAPGPNLNLAIEPHSI